MRIVDVCAFYSPRGGGVRTYIDRKLRAAPAQGHEVIVVAPGPEEQIVDYGNGAILHTIPGPAMPLDRRYHYFEDQGALHACLDRWRPSHVEASSPWSSATMVARWDGAATRSLVLHSDPLSSYAYRWLGLVASQHRIDDWFDWYWRHLRALDNRYDALIAPNEQLRGRLVDGGLRKVVTIPLGVEPGIFSPRHRSAALRRAWLSRLGLPETAKLLIAVGRFSGEKRWPMVLRAANEASRDKALGLVLVGDGPQSKRLRRLARRMPHVAVADPLTERSAMARLMASADGLVHGCETETFGLSVSEAIASGLPIIVPDQGGAFAQLSSGSGMAYKAANRASLVETLRRFARGGAAGDEPRRPRSVRTIDQHFIELFALYCVGLPLSQQVGDAVSGLANLAGLG
jgi:alpha-1,6-mannosyltransferase